MRLVGRPAVKVVNVLVVSFPYPRILSGERFKKVENAIFYIGGELGANVEEHLLQVVQVEIVVL